jgi:hypothetical protein
MSEPRESDIDFLDAVRGFMQIAGQTTDKFNARQACLYTGLELEEMAERIAVISQGCISPAKSLRMKDFADLLSQWAAEFKAGKHEGDILRCDHAQLIDGQFDGAWVSVAACFSTSLDAESAFRHGTFTNLDKFRGGVAIKDENGKVKKPADWKAPDFEPYVDPTPRV